MTLAILVPRKLNFGGQVGVIKAWVKDVSHSHYTFLDQTLNLLRQSNPVGVELFSHKWFTLQNQHSGYFMLTWKSPLPQPPQKSWTMALVIPVTGSNPLPFPEPVISTHIPQPRDFWKSSGPAATLIQPGWEDIGERGSKAQLPPEEYSP